MVYFYAPGRAGENAETLLPASTASSISTVIPALIA